LSTKSTNLVTHPNGNLAVLILHKSCYNGDGNKFDDVHKGYTTPG